MKRVLTAALMSMTAAAAVATAQPASPFKQAESVTSGVQYSVTNYGIFGHNVAQQSGWLMYPRNSRKTYLYGSGLWFGAVKSVDDTLRKLAFITYNPNSGASYASPGNSNLDDVGLYYSGSYDKTTGAFTGSGEAPTWPLWLNEGQGEANTYAPGVYEPVDSGRVVGGGGGRFAKPAFMPNVDEQFVVRYNDGDLTRYEGFGEEFGFPLGLLVQQNVYSFASGPYENVVVLQYEIVNTSDDTLFDCVVAQASDPDLGDAMNDMVSTMTNSEGKIRAGITTTGSESIGEFGALAQVLLEAPATDPSGYISNGRRQSQLRTHEINAFPNWTMDSDPATPSERYDWMRSSGITGSSTPGDKRTLLATNTFTMRPGDTAHFAMAFAVVDAPVGGVRGGDLPRGSSAGASSTAKLSELMANLADDFQSGLFRREVLSGVETDEASVGAMTVHPNPSTGATTLQFSTASTAEVTVSLVNALGDRIETTSLGRLDAGSHRTSIDVTSLEAGRYLVVIDAGGVRRTTILTVTH